MIEEDKSAQSRPVTAQTPLATSGSEPSAAFTPGPWVYRTGTPWDWGWVSDAAGGFIAQAKDPRLEMADLDRYRAAKTDPWEANARLIAAAPDLYEALKAILPAVDAYLMVGGGGSQALKRRAWAKDVAKARSALARADSRQ